MLNVKGRKKLVDRWDGGEKKKEVGRGFMEVVKVVSAG